MTNGLPDFKRKALERRRASLLEEYDAVNRQLDLTLEAGQRVRLERQLEDLERQIAEIDAQLGHEKPVEPLPPESEKAPTGTSPAPSGGLYGKGNRWAVLVGVNGYTDQLYPQLQVCVKDVEAIHAQLVTGGFDPARIHLLTDNTDPLPTRAEIFSSLEQAAKAAQRDDLVLFYYSGHGDAADGVSYLVAREGRPHALKHTAVALSDVVGILEKSQARAKVIILDACHSGANFEGKGPKTMPPDFIERVFEQAKGQVILASCEQGQVSHEWQAQERSVFTHFLLEALQNQAYYDEKGFVTVQDVNRHVTNGVTLWAFQHKRTQTPTLQGKMAGDIILVRK
jgi:hypothetical protein